MELVEEELTRREQAQHERDGKCDDLHWEFAMWLLERFDKRDEERAREEARK